MSEENISLFILKNSDASLSQAESYLKNRGWIVASSSSLRGAINYILKNNPSFIMVSADHPNKKVKLLPKIIQQALSSKVIAFAEKSVGSSIKDLHEMNLTYSLFPPVSGPAIQRIILKSLKDEETGVSTTDNTSESNNGTEDSDVITFLGDKTTKDDFQKRFEMAKAALSSLASGETDEVYSSTEPSKGGAAYDPTKSSQGQLPGIIKGDKDSKPSIYYDPSSGKSKSPLMMYEQETPKEYAARMRELSAKHPGYIPEQGNQETDEDYTARLEQMDHSGFSFTETNPQSDWDSQASPTSSTEYKKGGLVAPIMESGVVEKKSKNYRFESSEFSKEHLRDSIIVKGAKEALEKTVVRGHQTEIEEIKDTTNVACIQIKSPRFSGYLVCALGNNKKIDSDFLKTIQKRLFQFLKDNGEPVSEKDSMDLKIEQVEFQDWALQQAEFLKKAVHQGNEVAMAFFPSAQEEPKLEESASEQMLKMSIDEFKADTPLEFDLYIYMPENQKYLLYTPTGKRLYGQQKNRLQEKGVTHLHMRKDSEHNVKKYKAQNFLNEKIQAYKERRKKG